MQINVSDAAVGSRMGVQWPRFATVVVQINVSDAAVGSRMGVQWLSFAAVAILAQIV